MRKKRFEKIEKMLEIPQEVTGFDELIIENFKGILEYEEIFVRINTHIGIININGYQLGLENMTNDDIKVTGKIESLEIERTVEENAD